MDWNHLKQSMGVLAVDAAVQMAVSVSVGVDVDWWYGCIKGV
jgi:hypothetical protein